MRMKRGDVYPFQYDLKWDDGTPMNLTSASSVNLTMTLDEETEPTVNGTCTIVDAALGRVQYSWGDGETDIPGMYMIEFQINFSSGAIVTVPSDDILWMLIIDSLKQAVV